MKMEEVDHLQILVTVYQTTRRHIPESCNLNFHGCWIFSCI